MKTKKIISVSALLAASLSLAQAQFSVGNLVVLQEGTGAAALSSAGTAIILNQYTTSGSFVNATTIPTTGGSALVNSGSATSEGALTRSADGQYLVIAGYNAAAGTASIAGTTSASVPRGVATVDASGNYSLAASTASFSANNIRSGASDGSGNFWAVGANSGTVYLGSGTPGAVQTTLANNRIIQPMNNNLFFTTASGTSRGIYAFTGMPTAAATPTYLINTGASSSPYDFAFNAGMTLAYVADDTAGAAGGIQRWDFSGSAWTLTYTLGTGAANIGARGLAVDFSGANPIIYATTAEATADRLITITDTGAGSTATTLATAGANTIFRGLDFAPIAAPEPSTLALAGAGIAAFIGFRRRNQK